MRLSNIHIVNQILLLGLPLLFLVSCKKDFGPSVDIYLLKSFTTTINTSTVPATVVISDAVLENSPLVADKDIVLYKEATKTFVILNDIYPIIKDFGQTNGFAVTVDKKPIYYGRFHPAYLSSITFGIATLDPWLSRDNELSINFQHIDGNTMLPQLDKRNDKRILNTLEKTKRLR
jgi:hypothetical protein